MSDLVAWLTKILDEEESGWRSQAWQDKEGVTKPLFHFGQPLTDLLLADIATKRAIIALHAPSGSDCRTCCGEPYLEEYWDGETETTEWKRTDLPSPCPTLRLLAQPYADRRGYDESWKP